MSASAFLSDVRLVIQSMLLIAFYGMSVFYAYQKKKKRCRWEPLYIAAVGGFVNTLTLIAGEMEPLSFYVEGVPKKAPWLRYASWMMTCPVLLVQLNNLAGQDVQNLERAATFILELNLMVILGATSAFSKDSTSLVFFMLSWVVCFAIFIQAWGVFKEAFATLPPKAKPFLYGMMFSFYFGWTGFGVLFAAGPEGWGPAKGTVIHELVVIATIVVDFTAKIVYGFIGWHLRWRVLRGDDGKVHRGDKAGPEGGKQGQLRGRVSTTGGRAAPPPLSRNVLLCASHDDYVAVVLRTKLAGNSLQVTVCSTTAAMADVLSKEGDSYAFAIVSLPMLRFCNGDIAQHPKLSARSPTKMLPLVTYTQHINDADFAFIRQLEIDDFIDAPFFDEDISETVQNAMSYARQLRLQLASTSEVHLSLP
mmetsp:Transcript_28700/g.70748  ORF Transcript_28700/g.70748 Transcript_28700/m.70748 type:complete len:420 (-) Transcript_28700:434-1693(-)|eukprot:CAMPEP_0197578998 /NCGR_PEP_ID=MMETSP1326-20131121/3077_1 /TAXON_ID=1155430 /ORGANISM="Genus nov. species nov., Strain RCC2288" /LENGTH=419 /DNA_ID=CAMNT_0043142323 /DNA_START=477 /DNA_END=1736 /DNA_ORIENTATION=+